MQAQGMSVAAMQALVLQELLAQGDGELARRFFARAAQLAEVPWEETLRRRRRSRQSDGATGAVPASGRYHRALVHAATDDVEVSRALLRVHNLRAKPRSLLAPHVARRVLGAAVVRRMGIDPAPPAALVMPTWRLNWP
jgi:hypothetical protein